MRVAKDFRWEAAHRLPWYNGPCAHLHGHSYHMTIELEGEPDARGMLVDFRVLKQLAGPLVDAWDHATLVAADDAALQAALDGLGSRYAVLPYDTTAENLCRYAAAYLVREGGDVLRAHRVTHVRVTVRETQTCYAQVEQHLDAAPPTSTAEAAVPSA